MPSLPPHGSIGDRFVAIAQHCVEEVLASADRATRMSDPDSLHDLRVAIRRTRAALSLFRAASAGHRRLPLAGDLRALQQRLGATREWDVFVDETLPSLPRRLRSRSTTGELARLAQARREDGRAKVRAVFREPQSIATLRGLGDWPNRQFATGTRWDAELLAQPARNVATAVMEVREHKARKLGRKIRKLDAAALHRLRIRIKKLRYAAEFLGELWPGRRTRRYLAALKDLQQALGTWHDAAVATELLAQLAVAGTEPVASWLVDEEKRQREEAGDYWRRFARRKPFWNPR